MGGGVCVCAADCFVRGLLNLSVKVLSILISMMYCGGMFPSREERMSACKIRGWVV